MISLVKLLVSTWHHPLNSRSLRSRLAALSRLVRWQIAARLMPEAEFIVPFVAASRLLISRGMVGATGNWYSGLDEPDEMGFLLHVLRAGDLFLDIGANVGSYTVLASSVPGVTGIAFEPVPSTFAALQRNLVINGVTERFQALQTGVGRTEGMLRFSVGLDSMNCVVGEDASEVDTVLVPVIRLDDAVSGELAGGIVAKIDVEGFEMPVLEGGRDVLAQPNFLAVVMETNGSGKRYGVEDDELFSVMQELGFSPYRYDAIARRLTQLDGRAPDGINTVFVKDALEVQRRINAATSVDLVDGNL